jgi:hypothetical protein
MSRSGRRWLSLLIVGGLVVFAFAGTALAKAPVKLGVYTATTANGSSFEFKVVDHCSKSPTTRCLYSDTYPTVQAPCPNGQTGGGLLNYPQGVISKSGKLSVVQGTIAAGTYVKFTVVFKGNSVNGTLRALYPETIGQATPACDSGTVTFTGHRGS